MSENILTWWIFTEVRLVREEGKEPKLLESQWKKKGTFREQFGLCSGGSTFSYELCKDLRTT